MTKDMTADDPVTQLLKACAPPAERGEMDDLCPHCGSLWDQDCQLTLGHLCKLGVKEQT